ncbi:ribosomal protein S18 acetylase RimI-like enzyme [Flavobacterium sp. CG_9.1]|uniref:GNAT family N-acetyltransferase n=1 Tax=Flavobacterium sp. CG_9.1 TaxID=2787728 RepID=UPI0018CB9A0A|nr:GNAT family N-acetyltransferase [Flavobacterium sp. CG_9.1]MBG6062608.1 ribosomal protein S18 acetylase RimI-like enzyme [Flavobacterium sp. CG_9.1]
MNPIEIQKATLNDLEILQKLSIQTFTETFAAVNTPDNITNYINDSFNTQQLTTELSNTNSMFYLAYSNRVAVGYLKINFGDAQTETHDQNALKVHRIYVLQTFHGKNIGQLLLNQAKKIAENNGVASIWLGVWEENYRALQFYAKNGFVVFDQHVFTLGNDKQTDLLMQLRLK